MQYFKRSFYQKGVITIASATPPTGFAFNFQLNGLPGFGDFVALYDQYKIKAIKWTLIPNISGAVVSQTASNPSVLGNIWSAIDYDDSAVPTSQDQLLQYQNVKRTRYHQIHSRYFKPKVSTGVFDQGAGALS